MAPNECIPAAGRNPNEEYTRYHWYKYVPHIHDDWCNTTGGVTFCDEKLDLMPMCIYGWNRANGYAFSILRNNTLSCKECKFCRKNIEAGKEPVGPSHHKTMWI